MTVEFGGPWNLLMAQDFKELEASMRPESLARAKEMMAEMLLSEIRRAVGLTQEQCPSARAGRSASLSFMMQRDLWR